MRLLNRDLNNIREMREDRKNAALKNLNKFNPNDEINCPICECERYELYVDIYGFWFINYYIFI